MGREGGMGLGLREEQVYDSYERGATIGFGANVAWAQISWHCGGS